MGTALAEETIPEDTPEGDAADEAPDEELPEPSPPVRTGWLK